MKPKTMTELIAAIARRWRDRGGTWWWAIVVIVIPVALIAAAAVTLLLLYVEPSTQPPDAVAVMRNKLDVIKVGLSVGAGTGGIVALVLTGRRQTSNEHDATERRLTELYVKAVEQLGSDKPAIRHGGLYALERVAQDNPDHRQTVVDVICAYLRAPFQLPGAPRPRNRPGIHRPLAPNSSILRNGAAREKQANSPTVAELDADARQEREVRLTAQRILAKHLKPGSDANHQAKTFWKDINLDLAGATLIDFSLGSCQINKGNFANAQFIGRTWFGYVTFTDEAWFDRARFTGDVASFHHATFKSSSWFEQAVFRNDMTTFNKAIFAGGIASFNKATFNSYTWFGHVTFTGETWFNEATFDGNASFDDGIFDTDIQFIRATFTGETSFNDATFTGDAWFDRATFTSKSRFDKTNFDMFARARAVRILVSSAKSHIEFPSWPHGWTAELPDVAPSDSDQAWVRLVPVPVILGSPDHGATFEAESNEGS